MDTQELPHAIRVSTANINDRQAAVEAFQRHKDDLKKVETVLVDEGYSAEGFAQCVKERIDAKVEVAKRSELHKFAVISKRWVVERSFAWIEQCRQFWKNCERKLNTNLDMLILAFIRLILKRS